MTTRDTKTLVLRNIRLSRLSGKRGSNPRKRGGEPYLHPRPLKGADKGRV